MWDQLYLLVCPAPNEQPNSSETSGTRGPISWTTTCLLWNSALHVVMVHIGNKTYQWLKVTPFLLEPSVWMSFFIFRTQFYLRVSNWLGDVALLILCLLAQMTSGSEIMNTCCFCLSSYVLMSSISGQFFSVKVKYNLWNWSEFLTL